MSFIRVLILEFKSHALIPAIVGIAYDKKVGKNMVLHRTSWYYRLQPYPNRSRFGGLPIFGFIFYFS